jgi:hypothetical protein
MSIAKIEQLITLINSRLFKGKQEDLLRQLWKEASFYPTCNSIVNKGERAGTVCGKAAVKGTELCMCHTPRVKKEKPVVVKPQCADCPSVIRKGQTHCKEHRIIVTCPFVLVKGAKKGEMCGKKGVCVRHQEKSQDRVQNLSNVHDVALENKPETSQAPRLVLSIEIPDEVSLMNSNSNVPKSPDYPPPSHIKK